MRDEHPKKQLDEIAKLAAQGDDDSFVALCDEMKVPLFRAAKGILGDEQLALDAVSEAVYRAYKGIKRLRQPQFVATWFTRILINAANDIYKQQKRYAPLEDEIQAAQEGAYFDEHSDLNFEQMIASLPSELREIISLKYYSEFTVEEIAEILKIPIGTVKSRLNRALKQLRMEVTAE